MSFSFIENYKKDRMSIHTESQDTVCHPSPVYSYTNACLILLFHNAENYAFTRILTADRIAIGRSDLPYDG